MVTLTVTFLQNFLKFTHLKAVVRPRAELHLAALVVEREPGDVDLAGGLEDAGRHVQAGAIVPDDHVGRVGTVEALVGTEKEQKNRDEKVLKDG